MAITCKIEGNQLVIRCDLEDAKPSATGKSLVVASTHGQVDTGLLVEGRPLKLGLNAYIKAV